MYDSRWTWVAVVVGVVALALGAAGLVVALNTKSDAVTKDDVKADLSALRVDIARAVGANVKQGEKLSEREARKVQSRARKQGKAFTNAAAKQRSVNAKTAREIQAIRAETNTLKAQTKQTSDEQAKQTGRIRALSAQVKRLQQSAHKIQVTIRHLRHQLG